MNQELAKPIQIKEYMPAQRGLYSPVEKTIPVKPLTDASIAALPFSERVQKIERLAPYSLPFLQEAFDIPVEEVRPETLALARILHDVETRTWEIGYYSSLKNKARSQYEAEKRDIRAGKKGHRAIDKKVAEASEKFQERGSELDSKVKASETLRNTIIDNFIIDTLLTPEGSDEFLLATADLQEQSYITEKQVIDLLKAVRERLNTMDPRTVSNLRYKDFEGNLVTAQQAAPLSHLVKVAFSQNGTEVKHALSDTAKSLLDFYWKNNRAVTHPEDKTPRIAVIYDILLAATSSGDPTLVKPAVGFVQAKIEQDRESFYAEFLAGVGLYSEEAKIIEDIFSDLKKTMIMKWDDGLEESAKDMTWSHFMAGYFSNDERANEFNPEKIGGKYGTYTDRILAISTFSSVAKALGLDYTFVSLMSRMSRERPRLLSNSLMKKDDVDIVSEFMTAMATFFPDTISLVDELQGFMDKDTYFETYGELHRGEPRSFPDSRSRQSWVNIDPRDPINDMPIDDDLAREKGIAMKLLYAIFADSGIRGMDNLVEVSLENERLTKLIRDTNLWFVAEQGDQFNVLKNPELANYSIKSVTIYPMPDYQGERIVIKTDIQSPDHTNKSVELTLARNGKVLLYGDSPTPHSWLEIGMTNFLLKRVHFITSGLLGERGGHEIPEDYESGQPTEVRRSHWRILTSNGNRKYTLNSPQAQAHAEFVKETYGLDIYEENLRRRIAGTLKPNQVLTFVKAVKGQAEPNQLMFDESKLNLAA